MASELPEDPHQDPTEAEVLTSEIFSLIQILTTDRFLDDESRLRTRIELEAVLDRLEKIIFSP